MKMEKHWNQLLWSVLGSTAMQVFSNLCDQKVVYVSKVGIQAVFHTTGLHVLISSDHHLVPDVILISHRAQCVCVCVLYVCVLCVCVWPCRMLHSERASHQQLDHALVSVAMDVSYGVCDRI